MASWLSVLEFYPLYPSLCIGVIPSAAYVTVTANCIMLLLPSKLFLTLAAFTCCPLTKFLTIIAWGVAGVIVLWLTQGYHFSALTKFQDFSRILYKIPGIIFFFFKCGFHIQLGKCLHFTYYFYTILSTLPKSMQNPLTATHNDLYHFERWVLIKKWKLMT